MKCLRSCNASSLNETAVHELTGEGKGKNGFSKGKGDLEQPVRTEPLIDHIIHIEY